MPLYRRMDFLEHQLAQFVHDPEIRQADLIYVLDSPEDADPCGRFAAQLFRLYGVPFRVAVLTTNGGFSIANNLGASLARGRQLLLLNSDVLPERAGLARRSMVAFYDATPEHRSARPEAALRGRLDPARRAVLRPTGRAATSGRTSTSSRACTAISRPPTSPGAVPAVTGACMLIDRDLFQRARRAARDLRAGRLRGHRPLPAPARAGVDESWYLPDVELYHLEGQSYPTPERALTPSTTSGCTPTSGMKQSLLHPRPTDTSRRTMIRTDRQ